MFSRLKNNHWVYSGLLIFFFTLVFFVVKDKILFTPDFGQSDAYHLNFATKHFLARNLRSDVGVPFWTSQLGGGYPLYSEAQVGTFYIPNIILLKLLPFETAYPLLFIIPLFLMTWGMYLFLAELTSKKLLSLLVALNFTFSGAIVLRLVHLNLIHTLATVPFLFLLTLRYIKTGNLIYGVLFAFILSQAIFGGHSQVAFIALVGVFIWTVIFLARTSKITIVRALLVLGFFTAVGLALAAPQIVPSSFLSSYTTRALYLDYREATYFPFNFSDIAGFALPEHTGTPKQATYPHYSSSWGIYWENTPYLGLLAFIVAVAYFVLWVRKGRRSPQLIASITVVVLAVLISLGSNSPLFFLFNFPPFNFFRVPSRFLLLATFFIFVFLAQEFAVQRKKVTVIILYILLIVNLLDLLAFGYSYHLFVDKERLNKSPEMTEYLDGSDLYVSFGQGESWNEVLATEGWILPGTVDKYVFLRNFLYARVNLIWGKNAYSVNSPLDLRTFNTVKNLLESTMMSSLKGGILSLDNTSVIDLLGISRIITSYPIENPNFTLLRKLTHSDLSLYMYSYKNVSANLMYVPESTKLFAYVEELKEAVELKHNFVKEAFVEDKNVSDITQSISYQIHSMRKDGVGYTIDAEFEGSAFIVFRQNYYPLWELYIDGKKTPIYRTNLVHMGALLSPGRHTIELTYSKEPFYRGLAIAAVALVAIAASLVGAKTLQGINRSKE